MDNFISKQERDDVNFILKKAGDFGEMKEFSVFIVYKYREDAERARNEFKEDYSVYLNDKTVEIYFMLE